MIRTYPRKKQTNIHRNLIRFLLSLPNLICLRLHPITKFKYGAELQRFCKDIQLFVIYDSRWIVLVWTVGWTKKEIGSRYFRFWENMMGTFHKKKKKCSQIYGNIDTYQFWTFEKVYQYRYLLGFYPSPLTASWHTNVCSARFSSKNKLTRRCCCS